MRNVIRNARFAFNPKTGSNRATRRQAIGFATVLRIVEV